jgi:hypothetical protein
MHRTDYYEWELFDSYRTETCARQGLGTRHEPECCDASVIWLRTRGRHLRGELRRVDELAERYFRIIIGGMFDAYFRPYCLSYLRQFLHESCQRQIMWAQAVSKTVSVLINPGDR